MINTCRLKRALVLCFLILSTAVFLAGCENLKAKREAIHQHRVAYCSKTANSLIKKIAIKAIRAEVPLYPVDGICIGINDSGC